MKQKSLYAFGSFLVDLDEKKLWKGQELVPVTPKVFQTFAILFQNRDTVVTKQALVEALWPDCYVDEANLTQNISVLRKALDETHLETRYIVTFPKRGYRFVGEVRQLEPANASGPTGSAPEEVVPTRSAKRKAYPLVWVAITGAIALWSVLSFGWNRAALPFEAGQGVTHLLGDEFQPVVSPDGAKLAFVHHFGLREPLRIGVLDRGNSSGPRIIDTPEGDAFSPAWSPDAQSLAYLHLKRDRLFLIVRDSQDRQRVVAELYPRRLGIVMRQLDWSPDGRLLAVVDKKSSDEPFGIDLIHIADGRRTPLTVAPVRSDGDFEPRFSPDGKRLAFLRVKSRRSMSVMVVRMPGSPVENLTTGTQAFGGLDWTPDSKALLFSSKRDRVERVWRIRMDRSRPEWEQTVLAGAHPLQFSVARKSGHVAFAAAYPHQNIWRATVDSGGGDVQWERFIASAGNDSCPVYAPDGRSIAFLSDRTGDVQLWLRKEDGREVQLTAGALAPNYASWGRDRKELYFSSSNDRRLYRVSADGGQPVPIPVGGPVGGHVAVTPDNKWLLLVQRFNIYQAPIEGGERSLVSDQGGYPMRLSSDGDSIYYVRSRLSSEICRLSRSTSRVELITDRLSPGCWGCWDVSQNRKIFYVTGSTPSENLLVESLDLNTGKRTVLGALPSRLPPFSKGVLALSPDAKWLLADVTEPGDGDVQWINPPRWLSTR